MHCQCLNAWGRCWACGESGHGNGSNMCAIKMEMLSRFAQHTDAIWFHIVGFTADITGGAGISGDVKQQGGLKFSIILLLVVNKRAILLTLFAQVLFILVLPLLESQIAMFLI